MEQIKIAIIGNGDLGRAVKRQMLLRADEFNLVGGKIFSSRESDETIRLDRLEDFREQTDVAIFCGSSQGGRETTPEVSVLLDKLGVKNLTAPEIVPWLNLLGFNTVDPCDAHLIIKNGSYQQCVSDAQKRGGKETIAIIATGWHPGLLSRFDIEARALMPFGSHNMFYGEIDKIDGKENSKSQGHTTLLRGIPGVIAGIQFTHTREDALEMALAGNTVPKNDCQRRVCYIVAKPGMEQSIDNAIRSVDGYFKNQLTEINFVSIDEYNEKYANIVSHSGRIISTDGNITLDIKLSMKSNPECTAGEMLKYAVASCNMRASGMKGVFTVADIAPAMIMPDYLGQGRI